MTKAEKLLASRLLERASDEFGNHGCNDMDMEMFTGISEDDRQEMARLANFYNNPNTPLDEIVPFKHIGDFFWMGYLASRLEEESK